MYWSNEGSDCMPKGMPHKSPESVEMSSSDPPARPEKARLSDIGNARRFAARNRERLRYVGAWGKWIVWDGRRWAEDHGLEVYEFAKQTVDELLREASGLPQGSRDRAKLFKHAVKSEQLPRIEAMIRLARSNLYIPHEQFDDDTMSLNVLNGRLNLETGTLHPHRPDDYITRLAPVEWHADAVCPTWERFLEVVFEGNAATIAFIQRLLGYCLTGCVNEQVMPIFSGGGANGKSTLVESVMHVLGPEYSASAAPDLLLVKRGESHPTERASLFRKRLVAANESGSGRLLSETTVKDFTSSQRLMVRRMREDFWEFEPTHKLVFSTNHLPEVRGTDHAIWRRLCIVPFNVTFWNPDDEPTPGQPRPEHLRQDKRLAEKLRAESPGILAWLVRGCSSWQRQGLGTPPDVHQATGAYRRDQDTVGRFLQERCLTAEDAFPSPAGETTGEFYRVYEAWCAASNEVPVSQRGFASRLAGQFTKYTSDGTRYRGLRLKPTERRDGT